ncbi:type IV secretory system conjugative DNA transfer family protein [Altererythrobacter sp. ZODW24]|uniref:type IV secretory system conjugative DNA transfer family protein n=1 Tax=Altererythrobacter sp. ZODW24 TaxID=2185142 RepID=UPI000DF75D0C|nr:type IV secretory system conjugative DNA transfer family protein [Altererythrobacter sp. ZODW24]
MASDFGAWLHSFWHGLFRPSEKALVQQKWQEVAARLEVLGLNSVEGRDELIASIATEVRTRFGDGAIGDQHAVILSLVKQLFEYDNLFLLPIVDWDRDASIAELWEIRETLTRQQVLADNLDGNASLIELVGFAVLKPIYDACPALLELDHEGDGISIPTDLMRSLGDIGTVTETVLGIGLSPELVDEGLMPRLHGQLEYSLIAASGGNPADPASFKRAPKMPSAFDAKTPEQLVATYLGGTPLAALFDQTLNFTIPTKSRFEHQHIVAGSGHGKTQTLQYLIAQDLAAMETEKRSIIVLDSQGDLIRNIAQLDVFGPGGALHDRLVLIDPTDVEYPVSLNLFDVGQERLSGYEPLERERLTNSILELYDFVLGTLLDAQMTQKQNVIFRYVTRLMLHIPDATIHTLRELMEPDSEVKFAEHIAKLEGTAKHFFATEFASREFEQTKKQVLRRLWGILENQTFERMFSHPRSKLDIFKEMNAGKVILVNTAKDLLKEQGTEIFGRFFIAMIAQAAQERATLKGSERVPAMVYIDEAQDYFDRNIGLILAQARKYNVGMVLAHQYLGQLEPKLQEAFAANTAIKFAGGVSAKDARSLAPQLYTDAAFIEAQGKGSFAAHVRGVTKNAVPLTFPFGHMEGLPVLSAEERAAQRETMRSRYAVHHSQVGNDDPDDEELGEDSGDGPQDDGPPPDAPKPKGPKPGGSGPKGSAPKNGAKAKAQVQGENEDKKSGRGHVATKPGEDW